jgi:hypothetical protein
MVIRRPPFFAVAVCSVIVRGAGDRGVGLEILDLGRGITGRVATTVWVVARNYRRK